MTGPESPSKEVPGPNIGHYMESNDTSETEPRRRGRPPMVHEAAVVAVARQIVVEEGVSKLTMRRLGAALEMDSMVPYRFFKTKDDLLEAIMVSILVDVTPEEQPDPVDTIGEGFRQFRRVLVDVPNLFSLVGPRLLTTPAAMLPIAWVVSILRREGMPAADAIQWNTVLISYVAGSVSFVHGPDTELHPPDTEDLPLVLAEALAEAGPVDLESHFEWGFARLLDLLRSDLSG